MFSLFVLGHLEQSSSVPTDHDTFLRNVVVIDFGLARDFKKYSTGVMGTPGYMPPEAASLGSLGVGRCWGWLCREQLSGLQP